MRNYLIRKKVESRNESAGVDILPSAKFDVGPDRMGLPEQGGTNHFSLSGAATKPAEGQTKFGGAEAAT